ncbi:response regulator [Orbaceae bacterium ac157xtp]
MSKKILLVDDDQEITSLLKELLELEEFEVEIANNGYEALQKFDESVDLILLDIMMPDIDGYSVLTKLRAQHTVPIIFLTAKDSEFDKILGLELGADDYIIKPFNDRELIARIRATLRRKFWDCSSFNQEGSPSYPAEYSIDNLKVNVRKQVVFYKDKYIDLTGTEFLILLKLLEFPGKIISRDTLSESVLGKQFSPFARSIDVHVSNLRKKLPERKSGLPWIKTLRSKGYLFVIEE